MMKDFLDWNNKKIIINKNKRPYFKEREVWFVNLGVNIGFEQDGVGEKYMRPVLIFKKFNKEIFWGIPLSRKVKNNIYYINLETSPESSVIISQIRLLDAKRLSHKINTINKIKFYEIKEKFKDLTP